MQVLVLGGTGAIGLLLIPNLLKAGHNLTLYVRSPQKLPSAIHSDPRVRIVQGELTDSAALLDALTSVQADAVVSVLGPYVFSHPASKPISRCYSLLIAHMHALGVGGPKRLIVLGTTSQSDPNDQRDLPLWLSMKLIGLISPSSLADILENAEVVRKEGADLEWTIVRCPWLTNGMTGRYQAGYKGDGKRSIFLERAGYAAFVVDELRDRKWVQKAPMLSISAKSHED